MNNVAFAERPRKLKVWKALTTGILILPDAPVIGSVGLSAMSPPSNEYVNTTALEWIGVTT